jgi:hypothetical protein
MDLNDKIEIQNKLVEEINKNIDLLISEDTDSDDSDSEGNITPDLADAFEDAIRKAQLSIDSLRSQSDSSSSISSYDTDKNRSDIQSVKLIGGDIEFKDEFSGKKITLGAPKGFKVAHYEEDSKGNRLYISGKENRIFKNNDLEDVVLIIKLPKPISEIDLTTSISVGLSQKSLITKKEEDLDDVVLRISSYK